MSLEPATTPADAARARLEMVERIRMNRERIAIDASTRLPVLAFFGSSVFWLIVGSVFALLASVKLHSPHFLDAQSWLTFGRVRPVHLNIVAYGWAAMAGVGALLWLMARLTRAELQYPRVLLVSCAIWNFAVAGGVIAILAGYSNSIEYLEFPAWVPPLLTVAYALVGLWTMIMFRDRREHHVYVSQWYLIAAAFWFPWLYTAVNMLLVIHPVLGVTQGTITWWYGHNVLGLWFTPIGLATVYYLLPKVLGRPIHSYYLSIVGFWSLALFYNWAGAHHLVGGPIPAWLVTTSVVGSMMMLIPVATTAINHHFTMVGNFRRLKYSPTLRFIVFGAMCYTLVSVQGSLESMRSINVPTHFTHFVVAHAHLGLYGFFSMVMFGGIYYIMPRLTGWEWASARLIQVHFWGTTAGIIIYFVPLTWGGLMQGLMLVNPKVAFIDIVKYTIPYLWIRTGSGILMTGGHTAFAVLFVMNLLHLGEKRDEPMLLAEPDEIEAGAEEPMLVGVGGEGI